MTASPARIQPMLDSLPLPRPYWVWLVVAIASVAPRSASADVTAAARAFARAQAAQLEGNYALAAEHFELAFALQPSKEALRSAARMQMSAKNFARAATHAQSLLDLFPEDTSSKELARSILDEVAGGLARYEVSCTPECALSVDQKAYFVEPARSHRLYLKPGSFTIEAHFRNGRKASRVVTTAAAETARFELIMPAAPPSPVADATKREPPQPASRPDTARASTTRSGVPVLVPWLTGAATVACGGLTLWAALDTQRRHEAYVEHPTDEQWTRGVGRQRLTNVLAASTAALGVATITLSFFVHGSSKSRVALTPSLGPNTAQLELAGKF